MPHLVQFGEFQADLSAAELYKAGRKLKIQERPFQVLAILLERSGEVVTREELRGRIWPADTFVDFDHSLAVAVNKLREALGDSADRPRFVGTVGRRGYRFLVPVRRDEPLAANTGAAAKANGQSAAGSASRRQKARLRIALAAVVVLLAAGAWKASVSRKPAPPQISSLAVLPLENLSGDPEQEYFAEGMTDELITDLAKIGALRVISRTSAMRYKGTKKSLPEIAGELNVDAVVEGTVSRSAGRVHITAQLIGAKPEKHLWAESYERPLGDMVALQDELARQIADTIRVKLTPQERASLARARSVGPDAYQLYLKGRYFWNKRSAEGLHKAVEYFEQAIAKDPHYAQAYAGLADSYVLLGGGYSVVPPEAAYPKARTAAEKALELDETLAEAHTSLALIGPSGMWDWAGREREFQRAIELNPNYATAHHWYAEGYLIPMGRAEEAIAEMRLAEKLDPVSPIIATDVGKELYVARHYDEAAVQLHKALELDPNFTPALEWLWRVYAEKGDYQQALVILARIKPALAMPNYLSSRGYLYAQEGRKQEARQLLRQLLLLARHEYVDPEFPVAVYISLGDKEQAFAWLEKAYATQSAYMSLLKLWSLYDPIRSDPRFADLLRRVGLPP